MKRLLFLIVLVTTGFATHCQEYNNSPVEYTEVVNVSNADAKELYAKAKLWIAQTYKDATKVIKHDDPENSILVGKGTMTYSSSVFMGGAGRDGYVNYDIEIACREGRYKYTFSNFRHEGKSMNLGLITNEEMLPSLTGLSGGPKKYKKNVSDEARERISSNILPLIASLKTAMETNDDW